MNYEQFLEIYHAGPEATYKLFISIVQVNILLSKRTDKLDEQIQGLEDRLNKNSRNSSKPPSTDEFVKPKSQRKKSGKPSGGQKGHKGHTLKMSAQPDHSITHAVKTCHGCGSTLEGVAVDSIEKRQVFDLPPLQIEVTEHLVQSKICPFCGEKNKSSFPEGITQPAQYGNRLKAFLVYLNQYQMLPYERLVELFNDVFNHSISEGTLYNANRFAYEALETTESGSKEIVFSQELHLSLKMGIRNSCRRKRALRQ